MDKDFEKLYTAARNIAHKNKLNNYVYYGHVGAAIMSDTGNIYTGVAIASACQIGFCAEHSAIAEMLKNNENRIVKIVSCNDNGVIIPSCGRCREFIRMINEENMEAEVMISEKEIVKLKDLLPHPWTLDSFKK